MTSSRPEALPQKSLSHDVLSLVSSTAFAQVISLVASPIITRIYGPESYGLNSLFGSVISIFAIVACLRYEMSIMLPAADDEAANLLALSLLVAAGSTLTCAIALFVGGAELLHLLHIEFLQPYLSWLLIGCAALGATSALKYWMMRRRRFGLLATTSAFGSVTTTLLILFLGLLGHAHVSSLIASVVIGYVISLGVSAFYTLRDDITFFRLALRWQSVRVGIMRYRKFPLIDLWSALLNTASWQVPIFFLARDFSPAVVGHYALAFRIIFLPMSLIGTTLSQVFFQRASAASRSADQFADVTQNVFRNLVALCAFPALLLASIGPQLLSGVFGSEWNKAGMFAQILAPWMLFWFISSPLSTIFMIRERQSLGLGITLVNLITRIGSMLIGGLYQNASLSLGLFSASGVIVCGLTMIFTFSLAGASLRTMQSILLRYMIFASAPVILLFACAQMQIETFGLLAAALAAGALYYAALMKFDSHLGWSLAHLSTLVRKSS